MAEKKKRKYNTDTSVNRGRDEQTCTNIVGYLPHPIEFNFKKGIIEIPANSVVRANKVKYVVGEKQELTMGSWGWLAFDITSGKFTLVAPTAPETKQQIICGMYVKSSYTVMMSGGLYYTVISDEHPDFVVFGDSITVGAGSTTSWEKILHEKAGVNVHTYGVGGSGYIAQPEDGVKTMFGYGGYEGLTKVLDQDVRVITRLKEYLPKIDTEYVILSAGTNDFYMGYSLDEFKAAVAECVEYVYSMGKTPILLSPTVRMEKINRNGINLTDYVNAIYEVSLEYNVPYIDCYNGMGLYPEMEENRKKWYYDEKAVHPNNAGYHKLACRIYQGLKETFILKY
ncbi:MAG: SGNH/GDSL hydrolase family protein [Lachnospiraceae bacterium]